MKTVKEILQAPFTEDELQARCAGFYPSRALETRDGRTVVAWTYGLPCVLPKADVIGFVISCRHWKEAGLEAENKSADNEFIVLAVTWKEVVRLVGERWEWRFNRYCVRPDSFPKPEELWTMKQYMTAQGS